MNAIKPPPAFAAHPPPTGRGPWRVMIVDDHPIVREGLREVVAGQSDMIVCGTAGDPTEAIGLLPRAQPELVLTDFTMPGRGGVEFIKDVWAFDPRIRILVLSMHEESHYAERALRAGASGFIMKSAGSEAILGAMRQVLAGGVFLSPALSSRLLRGLAGPVNRSTSTKTAVGQLSDREFEIFRLCGEGLEASEIAERLRLSRKTVDVHRANIKQKLNLQTSTALIRYAVQWLENEAGNG